MGLVSFWSNIAGPKVKEITPQCETPWLDRGRPTTSSGARFGKKRPGSASDGLDKRPITSNGDKKFKRIGRSLSRPRKALPMDSDIPPTPLAVEAEDQRTVPDIPAIPTIFSQERTEIEEVPSVNASPEKPNTTATSEGLNEMHIFELAAEPLPILPSTCYENPLIRPRSQSPTPPQKSTKGSQWFKIGACKNKALPPPPPPSWPLPPLPTEASSTTTSPVSPRRNVNSDGHPLRRSQSSASLSKNRPHFSRSSSENNFAKLAPTSVPALFHDTDPTPDSSVTGSEVSSVSSPTRDRNAFAPRNKRTPGSIDVTTARTHQYKDSGIGTPKTPFTPSGFKRWTPTISSTQDDEGVDVTGWTEADLQEWDRSLGQFRESIHKDDRYGGAGLMRSLEVNAEKIRTMNRYSNEQALAELHFGVLR